MSVEHVQIEQVRPVRHEDGSVSARVTLEGRTYTLELTRYSMRADDFQVLVQKAPGGALTPVVAPQVATYRGSIPALPGSRVSALMTDEGLRAAIRTPFGIYAVQPMVEVVAATDGQGSDSAPAGAHVVYRADDWINAHGYICGAPAAHAFEGARQNAIGGVAAAGTGLSIADVAIDTDVEFFAKNGSGIAATVHDIESVMDTVEFIYERDVTITYEITTIIVRTAEPDPYSATDPLDLLCQMRSGWATAPEEFIRRDTAHLFTGKNIDFNVIGAAFTGVMCNVVGRVQGCIGTDIVAYGFSESRFTTTFSSRVALTAHELGHNWGATHCTGGDCHIMCATLGGCGGLSGSNLRFGPDATDEILAHKSTRTCLSSLADPITPPFIDEFADAALDTGRWIFNDGATISTSAFNPPTPPNSLNLDASGDDPFQDDEVRSNEIRLGTAATPTLSYCTQHRGVPAGGAVVVEYRTADLMWRELNRVESDGIDQEQFTGFTHVLPSDASHDGFRVRFRAEVDGSTQDWFVDDVVVVNGCVDDAQCDDGLFCNGAEVCEDAQCAAGTVPCSADQNCDEDFDLCFDPACASPSGGSGSARYLAIRPPEAVDPVGFEVAPVCAPDGSSFVGPLRPTAPTTAVLVASPEEAAFLTSDQWPETIHVTGEDVVPGQAYIVRTACGTPDDLRRSAPIATGTGIWGDTAGTVDGGQRQPPDGQVNIDDILAILDRFANLSLAPPLHYVDLIGTSPTLCVPDGQVDVLDVLSALDAFAGNSYAETWPCPTPCGEG